MLRSIKIFVFFAAMALFFPRQSLALLTKANTDKVMVEILPAFSQVEKNENFDVLVKIEPQNNWHIYWDNPGDAGLPTQISWKLPDNVKVMELGHSAPKKYDADGLILYGYGESAYWRYRFIQNKNKGGKKQLSLQAKISWLACKEECVPETVLIKLDIPLVEKKEQSHPSQFWQDEVLKAKNSFPLKWKGSAFFDVSGDDLILRLNSKHKDLFRQAQNIWFIPYQRDIIDNFAIPEVGQDRQGNYSLKIPLLNSSFEKIDGILLIEKAHQLRAYELSPLQKTGLTPVSSLFADDENGFLWVLIMAFIGGIILNFMPCIFPILSIKAIALVQGAYNKRRARIEAVFYVLGVVVCFVVMASILIILRLQGEHIGWGFQLQSPTFVFCMIVVFFIVFLMLLDLINLKNPFANKVGRISFAKQKVNAFFTGLFAVLIASPCTAPFMGIAIGYTLSKPVYVYYPIFVALSLGYALPFALIAFFPRILLRILPKPGKWMSVLKKIFAIPVLLTCFWLAWVLWHLTNNKEALDDVLNWKVYDAQQISECLRNKQPVFIDFTAKWCITCLANEKFVLDTEYFSELVKKHNIQLFKADWTNKSQEITDALALYGRNSVPLYVYYSAGGNYVLLPQLLTDNVVKQYID